MGVCANAWVQAQLIIREAIKIAPAEIATTRTCFTRNFPESGTAIKVECASRTVSFSAMTPL